MAEQFNACNTDAAIDWIGKVRTNGPLLNFIQWADQFSSASFDLCISSSVLTAEVS